MALKIIYGIAGTGKSTYILKEVSKKIRNNEKVYIITPEQFTYSQEEKLLKSLGRQAVLQAEVISFQRMAYRIINEIQGNSKVALSKVGKAMLIYDILDKNKENLIFLGKTKQNTDLVINTITELKKHRITQKELEDIKDQIQDKYLNAKMQDIFLLYKAFQENIQEGFIDENDSLTILEELLDKTDMFKDANIYIDEFVGFTPQEYRIVEKLVKCGKQVSITVCTDELGGTKLPETDIFYSNKKTVEKLINLKDIEIEKGINLDEIYRFKSDELKHLDKNIYAVPYEKYKNEVENISLFLAQNPYSELEKVASTILDLVRKNNYRYRDIAIIAKNIEAYSGLAKAIFSKYNIPIFIDEKQDLNQNIFSKYLISFIDVFAKNWSYEAVMSYAKTGLCNLTKEEIFLLENYALRLGINRNKWYKGEWHIEEGEENLLDIRQKLVSPLVDFYKETNKNTTVLELTHLIYNFLEKENIQEKLQEKQKHLEYEGKIDLANQYSLTWNAVMEVLDEMVLVLGKEKVSFEKYVQILKAGLSESSIGKIPATQDQVILGDVDRSRSHKIKAVFIIGINDGVFPSSFKEEGFLNDKERETLKEIGVELAKGTKEQLYEENFNIYKALTVPEEKLLLSYTSTDSEGKTLRPSILITKIKRIFPKIEEKSDIIVKENNISTKETTFEEMLVQMRRFEDGEEISDIWFDIFKYYYTQPIWKEKINKAIKAINYDNITDSLSKEKIDKLYGNKMQTSVSKLEQYRSCPFSFYLKYGLKIEEKRKFQIQSLDTGNFMHEVIDSFFEKTMYNKIDLKEITDEEIAKLVGEIVEEKLSLKKYYIFSSIPKFRVLTNRLKRVLLKAMKYIIQTLTLSDFSIMGNEIEFKQGKHYPPIEINLENGKKVEIIGKIDRVDIAKDENGKYIRIIDYKSSVKNIDLNEVEKGIQLQLLTYLDAISIKEDAYPAGVLYFNLIEPIVKADGYLTEEEIEEKIRKQFKMQGLILADLKVVKMMDKTLEKGASNIIPAYIDSKDNISNSKSSSITRAQFENLQKYVNATIKQISEEILSRKYRNKAIL